MFGGLKITGVSDVSARGDMDWSGITGENTCERGDTLVRIILFGLQEMNGMGVVSEDPGDVRDTPPW
jgi:hypothetical protein